MYLVLLLIFCIIYSLFFRTFLYFVTLKCRINAKIGVGVFLILLEHYISLWTLVCNTILIHFFPVSTTLYQFLIPYISKSSSTSSVRLFSGLLFLVPSILAVTTCFSILSLSIHQYIHTILI
jgi:hypothetical protein